MTRVVFWLIACSIPSLCFAQPGGPPMGPGQDCYVDIWINCTDLYPGASCEQSTCVVDEYEEWNCNKPYAWNVENTGDFPSIQSVLEFPPNTQGYIGWLESWGQKCGIFAKCMCDGAGPCYDNLDEFWPPTDVHEVHWEPIGPPYNTCVHAG